jgi:glycosyltransferase involved in cell wall biosynthesis
LKNNILVSIIIPLYNKKQYIERCFNSVTNQIYKNIECIIVDDCSTDSSLELVNNLIKNYAGNIKFVLVKHSRNGGLSAARNTGINNSNGDYLFFLDADDEIIENSISSLVILAEKYSEVDMVQGNIITKRGLRKNENLNPKGKLPEFIKGNLNIRRYCSDIPETAWNKLVKKEFIINNSLYFKKGITHEDYHWRFFYLKKIESFVFTEENTYIFYEVPDSITTNKNLFSSISGCLTIAEDMLCNLDISLLEQQLFEISCLLNREKNKILSDEKYLSLLPKCEELLAKLPKRSFFTKLIMRDIKRKICETIKRLFTKNNKENK